MDHTVGNIRTKKALLRKEILAKRSAILRDDRLKMSSLICKRFLAGDDYKNASSILLYKAYNNEVDTDMIFEAALSDGKKVAYPLSRIVDGEPDLSFYIVDDHADLESGYKGIPEPVCGRVDQFTERADICVCPGVAFDKKCHRIGYGKAFYDRYIRLHAPRRVIGLAYDVQIVPDMETEESDMPVDIVITEKTVYEK